MANQSLWIDISNKTNTTNYPSLSEDISVDIAIIGAGITGITTAYELTKKGKSVAVIDSNIVGGYTTSFSTGNLYVPVQPYYYTLLKKFPIDAVRSICNARKQALTYIEEKVNTLSIDCQFAKRPWYLYTSDDHQLSHLDQELEALNKLGANAVETSSLPLALEFKRAIKLDEQARFNPLRYVQGLAQALPQKNAQLFEHTHALSIKEEKNNCKIQTDGGVITAKQIVLATHTPIGILPAHLFTAPYRSYVVAVRLKNNHYPEGHFWDLSSPHHATCTHPILKADPELLLVAGNHHKTGQSKNEQEHFAQLVDFLRQRFDVEAVSYQWSAQHYHSADGAPYIGLSSRFSKNVYIATGFFADGLVYGTVAGVMLAQMMTQEPNQSNTLDAKRLKPIASSKFLFEEGINVFWQYLKDMPFASSAFKEIAPGEGKVIEQNQQKWAVSRDENNQLHVVSAVCTHMKCIVNWNKAEKTWDCPCHGSRFNREGKVIEGPAISDLERKGSSTLT